MLLYPSWGFNEMFNRNVMAAHQLFSFPPSVRFLLLYLPLKIHFKASLLELVITLCPPPHQLQDQSHGERLSSFASFLSSSTSRNDKHLLSSAVPPSPHSAHPACCANPLHMSAPRRRCPSCQAGACMQFVIVGMHVNGDGRLSRDKPFSLFAPRASRPQWGGGALL